MNEIFIHPQMLADLMEDQEVIEILKPYIEKKPGMAMWRKKQGQQEFFNTGEMPEQNWCWVVESRYANIVIEGVDIFGGKEWTEWSPAQSFGVCHFRSEAGANEACAAWTEANARKIKLKMVEFRVVPKYVGYVPDQDEAWIKP